MSIIETADGSNTVRHTLLGELYHSDRGAVGESAHIFIDAGLCYSLELMPRRVVSIFEVGFGTGLNAWLTLLKAMELDLEICYHAIELYPLDPKTASDLNYSDDPLFMALHTSPWEQPTQITDRFTLCKYKASLTEFTPRFEGVELVYFDAFSPEVQPELWSNEIFRKIHRTMTDNGILVTYSAKGVVKEALRSAEFSVSRLKGALGKRHMVRAIKTTSQHD